MSLGVQLSFGFWNEKLVILLLSLLVFYGVLNVLSKLLGKVDLRVILS